MIDIPVFLGGRPSGGTPIRSFLFNLICIVTCMCVLVPLVGVAGLFLAVAVTCIPWLGRPVDPSGKSKGDTQ